MCLKSFFCITLVLFIFVISFIIGFFSLTYPWILLISECLKEIQLPNILKEPWLLNYVAKGVSDYFKHTIIYEKNARNKGNESCIQCLHPHGVIPYSAWCIWASDKTLHWSQNRIVTAHQIYNFPFISHYAKAYRGIPSEYTAMKNTLSCGESLMVFIGGIREMFASSEKEEVLVLKKRAGIFRLALETGADMIPMYTFGLNQVYQKSQCSFKIPFLFGRSNISWYYGRYWSPFPMKKKLTTVVGNPISVKKIDVVTEVNIANLRRKYIEEVKKLYLKWSKVLGYDKKLIIR